MFYFRLAVLARSQVRGLLHFLIPSSPRLRVLRMSLFSRSCPRIPSHSIGQNGKNFIKFHFITKSRFNNRYFPFIPALDYVINPKMTKINRARNDCPQKFSPFHPSQMLYARVYNYLSHYIIQSGNSAIYLTRSRGDRGVGIQGPAPCVPRYSYVPLTSRRHSSDIPGV
jgi:hypothetical protein